MTIPTFFMPGALESRDEAAYETVAKFCSRSPHPMAERIYAIKFDHDGIEWTATVGKRLEGEKPVRMKSGSVGIPLSDPATVVAIFGGTPYVVATSARPIGDARSAWENPFFASRPKSIVRFRQSEGSST